jgi:hypothetical protein
MYMLASYAVLTDFAMGDLAIVAGWKLKGLPSCFFSGVVGEKYDDVDVGSISSSGR